MRLSVLGALLLSACGAAAPTGGAAPLPPVCRASLSGEMDVEGPALEPPVLGGVVAEVRLEGARTVPEELLLSQIRLARGATLEEGAVRDDVRRLMSLQVLADVVVAVERAERGASVVYTVVERPLVRDVTVIGAGSGVDARRALALPGEVYSPGRLNRLTRRLVRAHQREGYPDAKVALRGRRRGERMDVCFVVDAGRRAEILALELVGNERLDDEHLLSLMATHDGRTNSVGGIYRADLLTEDAQRILAAYYDAGMLTAEVGAPELEWEEDGVRVAIPIREGKVFRIGEVTLWGWPGESAPAVGLRPGAVFSRSEVVAAIQRLEQASPGEPVRIVPETQLDPASSRVDLHLHVETPDGRALTLPEVDVSLSEDELELDLPASPRAEP